MNTEGAYVVRDLVALQEIWPLPDDLPYLSTIHGDVEYTGKAAGVLRGPTV